MTRVPLSILDPTPYLTSSTKDPTSPPDAWIAIILAACFLIVGVGQSLLAVNYRATVTWTVILTAILECFSLIEFAYSRSYPVSPAWLVAGTIVHWVAPAFLTFFCLQIFGRSAWNGVRENQKHLPALQGFLRLNTVVFGISIFVAWLVVCIGGALTVAAAPDGQPTQDRAMILNAGTGFIKGGLIIQLIVLLAIALIIWRFQITSMTWEVEWNEKRQWFWTWRRLVSIAFLGIILLIARQIFYMVRFFHDYDGLPWLALIFDTLPVLTIIILFTVYHPGRCLAPNLLRFRVSDSCLQRNEGVEAGVFKEVVGKDADISSESERKSSSQQSLVRK